MPARIARNCSARNGRRSGRRSTQKRPESHTLHHERGVHARNYGDLPLFDKIFGTFANPREVSNEVGFYEGWSKKLGPMLAGRLIS